MIVTVKRNKKQKYIKYISFIALVLMFVAYYFHVSEGLKEQESIQLAKKLEKQKNDLNKKRLEKALFAEIEKVVDLLGQEEVKHVKILKNKLVIICEPNTNLEALKVRYGAMALTKRTPKETIIAVDIKHIVESRLNEK